MAFALKAWKILVGIKDGLALLFLLLFFVALATLLSSRPNAASIYDGALLLDIDGVIVEEPQVASVSDVVLGNGAPTGEYRARDIVRAVEAAAEDDQISAIVLDLDRFVGAGQTHLSAIGEALEVAKAADKTIYAYATAYSNDGYQLAVHADEVWLNPVGGVIFAGPGGSRLYYGALLDRLNVTAHVYRVGTFKSAVEPYIRSDQSEEAAAALRGVYEPLWQNWIDEVSAVRPDAQITELANNPIETLVSPDRNFAEVALDMGVVDRLGGRAEFEAYLAEQIGENLYNADRPLPYAHNRLVDWLAANPIDTDGLRVGVVTIAGTIVDGNAGPGTAGGDRIAGLLQRGLDEEVDALVVRVNSPGGSVTASERMRLGIEAYREADIPVVVSFGNVAASGGYWVATAGDHILADPSTITGSIGVFAVLPSFEGLLADYDVGADGVTTSPLSGQPDIFGGFNDSVNALLQTGVENSYRRFLTLVGEARGRSPAEIDGIAQGRVWDGGTARQLGLVDGFGSLDDAIAEAARRAAANDDDADGETFHPVYLDTAPDGFGAFLAGLFGPSSAQPAQGSDVIARLSGDRAALMQTVSADLQRLFEARGAQALCLECGGADTARAAQPSGSAQSGWITWLMGASRF